MQPGRHHIISIAASLRLAFSLLLIPPAPLLAQTPDRPVVLRGRVLDFKTKEPIAKASVAIRAQLIDAVTAADGTFELANVRPGIVEVDITTVGLRAPEKANGTTGGIHG